MLNQNIQAWLQGALSIDLEVAPDTGRITALAAVRADSRDSFTYRGRELPRALRKLDEFARGTSFLLGHNIIQHDRPYLRKFAPKAALLRLPVLDTLYLSPLAFPRNPYHRLVKHYKDGALRRMVRNDPELDARITLELLTEQCTALAKVEKDNPRLLLAWHGLMPTTAPGFDAFFMQLRSRARPTEEQTRAACRAALLDYGACVGQVERVLANTSDWGWPLAYALAWASVAEGGNSVLAPWVRHEFPATAPLVTALRDTACTAPECAWCRKRHDARAELKRWTGFSAFRPEPRTTDDHPMQQVIVEAAMGRRHVLGILPTGTGKSLCYQVPALSRYAKTGALTVVISPLVALMADQVRGMERKGIHCSATYNSMLSMPERRDVLDRLRLGDIGILITSPEQLRSRSMRRTLEQREIGAWVLDEAHCLAKWGHDFRPDYRYVSRFIAKHPPVPPILCLTATAKQDVIKEIKEHFQEELGIAELEIYDGGMERDNLAFRVHESTQADKYADLVKLLQHESLKDGGAIVYCSTRNRTKELAEFLTKYEISAEFFHGDLPPERKKDVQRRFIDGKLQVITATNAFGMGIDKPDVRMVVHADMPGALENYLQEAGRAGRDGDEAQCVLLYDSKDIEHQFRLTTYSRLKRAEINAALRALRRLDDRARKRDGHHNSTGIEVTAGELLLEEESASFRRDTATDDTRVRTAVAWLEEAGLLVRGDNWVEVFPSSLRVDSIEEAQKRIERRVTNKAYQERLLAVVKVMLAANSDESVSTDQLMQVIGTKDLETAHGEVRKALYDLENLGICNDDTALTVYVHQGVANQSTERLAQAAKLEQALIRLLREHAPDQEPGKKEYPLHLRVASQRLKDANLHGALPERLRIILRGLAADGRGADGKGGSLALKDLDRESVLVYLNRGWDALETTAALRRDAAHCLLRQLLSHLPPRAKGVDLLAETTLGKLYQAVRDDIELRTRTKDPQKLVERALLWLHELEIVRLHKGMLVFRPAMTIKLERSQRPRKFTLADFEPLEQHYAEQVAAIHIMAEYARRGLDNVRSAQELAADYFRLPRQTFIGKWLPGREKELELPTTSESRHDIEGRLSTTQRAIVTDSRERANVLVLAGPGSGKTRVIVHRIAYLVRVRRENPRSILALAYNRHTAVDIRCRLEELIGTDDARHVAVLTCHALAMRLCGASFADRASRFSEGQQFDQVLEDAEALLKGEGLEPEEADSLRERLLAGFRWICVDEYQDVNERQYKLISALAGRTLQDPDVRLNLMAVGDDDQNIYTFAGASVEYIHRFTKDYDAKSMNLVENYRSTRHIINAANCVIAPAAERQKKAFPIRIDRRREKHPPGGDWGQLDPGLTGHVQLLQTGVDSVQQAIHVMDELKRMQGLDKHWDWSRVAVISRTWGHLEPVRAYCEHHNIPAQAANEGTVPVWRLRETQALVQHLRARGGAAFIKPGEIRDWIEARQRASNTREDDSTRNRWWQLLGAALEEEYLREYDTREVSTDSFIEWLAEWAHDARQARRWSNGLQLLSAHRAKGLEFDHVVVLDGSWQSRRGKNADDPDAERRLYYVAMTRARKTLALCRMNQPHPILDGLTGAACFQQSREPPPPAYIPSAMHRRYLSLSPGCVDIGYAGRFEPHKRVHKTIAALHPGDQLTLKQDSKYSWLRNPAGNRIGKLSRTKKTQDKQLTALHKLLQDEGMECISAQVHAIYSRRREDAEHSDNNQAQYADPCCDSWEVVLPELVFAPKDSGRL